MLTFRPLALLSILAAALLVGEGARAADSIRFGDLNSYTALPAFSVPYRKGWQLALDEVNAAGGLLGRPLEVVSRDDGGKPADAVTAANELVTRERVSLLMGTLLSHVGLAVSDYARQRSILFLAAEPLTDALVWDQGHKFTFRLRPGTYVQAAILAEEAAKLPAKRWVTVAPNYEYGKSAVEAFRRLLKEKRPDVEFVGEQWPALGKIEAGPTVQALARAEPEAIFNVLFGPDLGPFVREGQTRGLFRNREVVSLLSGEPEWIDHLKDEAPRGWIVTGYPWYAVETPEHAVFHKAYEAKFNEYPRMGSVVGYVTLHALVKAIQAAGTLDTEKVIGALRGLTMGTPFGPMEMRAVDQQSTMGTFVGRLTVQDGMPRMVDWTYKDGAAYLPAPEQAAQLRRKE